MRLYAGIDLHANNNYLGIVDEENNIVFKHKLTNDLRKTLAVLEPFREQIEGVVVESTFDWYWLVDGLMDHGYRVHLANPAVDTSVEAIRYPGERIKHIEAVVKSRVKLRKEFEGLLTLPGVGDISGPHHFPSLIKVISTRRFPCLFSGELFSYKGRYSE